MAIGKWSILLLSLVCSATLAAGHLSEPIALKGVAIGAPANMDQLEQSLGFRGRDAVINGEGCFGTSCGYGLTTLAGTHAEIRLTVDKGSRVVAIHASFPSDAFPDVLAALHAKYGKPAVATRTMAQVLGGAKFQVISELWRDAAGNEMTISNHADAIHGFLMLQSKSEVDKWSAKRAAAKGDI